MAGRGRPGEHRQLGATAQLAGDVADLQAEAQVGLVGAEAVDGLREPQPGEDGRAPAWPSTPGRSAPISSSTSANTSSWVAKAISRSIW